MFVISVRALVPRLTVVRGSIVTWIHDNRTKIVWKKCRVTEELSYNGNPTERNTWRSKTKLDRQNRK